MFKDRAGAARPGLSARELVTEWDRRHGPDAAAWFVGELVAGAGLMAWHLLRLLARFPLVTPVVAVATLVYLNAGRWALAGLCSVVAVVLAGWRLVGPESFDQAVAWRVRGSWRGWWTYGRHWTSAMTMADLGDAYNGTAYVPELRRVRSTPTTDRLLVRLLQGQHPDDFSAQADTLAHTFGMLACRVRIAGPGKVWLDFTRRDTLAAPVPALPIPEGPDLDAVPIGMREDGRPWTVRVRGGHLLVAGVTGAGKGSVLWSLIRALAPLVRAGLVQLWVIDPKGGMELAIRGADALYHRFACDDPEDQAQLLEDAVAAMRKRARRLRGKTRKHTPTAEDPLVLVIIDELAALTAYRPRTKEGRELYGRIDQAINVLLSQGRAVGFSLLAAVQDPRKEVLPSRDLFPTRIALRLIEAEATDMVLGPGARDRGAACERIPEGDAGAGIGYAWSDGEAEPVRVRAGYPTDDDIGELVELYAPEVATR